MINLKLGPTVIGMKFGAGSLEMRRVAPTEYHEFHAHCHIMKFQFLYSDQSYGRHNSYKIEIWQRYITNSSINFDWFEFSILNPLKSITDFFLVPNEMQPSPF